MKNNPKRPAVAALKLPEVARSSDGYEFDPSSDSWKLNKDITIYLGFLSGICEETELGFRLALCRYAEEHAASHADNMRARFRDLLTDTNSNKLLATSLMNWRAFLTEEQEWKLGSLRGFLLSWNEWGFPGVSQEVVGLLKSWRLRGNEKGRAVQVGDPEQGPYTNIELSAIFNWANEAVVDKTLRYPVYAYLLTLIMTARRPIQVAALRGCDMSEGDLDAAPSFQIDFPRAKQRGLGFRKAFRSLPIIEDLYRVLEAQHQASVGAVESAIGGELPEDLKKQVPVFINHEKLSEVTELRSLRALLMGATPDRLHVPTAKLNAWLKQCQSKCTAKSERTGGKIRLLASRFRRTRGTRLRQEGFGAPVIAELLDHSDTQNVGVYVENTVAEAELINHAVGAKLAPFAQACMGTLIDSERDAIRGSDPKSRVPNQHQDAVGNCGNYGFCAAGFRACYTCHHFQPWVDGPHFEVLSELYEEKRRMSDAGCAREVVNANDQLILAVEHCVALCDEVKSKQGGRESEYGDRPPKVIDG